MAQQSLTIIIKKIKQIIKNSSVNESALSSTIIEACRLLDKKFPTIPKAKEYSILLNSNAKAPNYQNIELLLKDQIFKQLLKRKVDTTYYLNNKDKEIYSRYLGDFLDCVRLPNRLLIENPHKALEDNFSGFSIQSWSKPKSKSLDYNRHLKTSRRNKNKSYFTVSNDIVRKIELLIFNHGYGRMKNENKICFYGKISKDIGYSKNKNFVSYICVQCHRTKREKGTGTRVEIHSYPVSFDEIKEDFLGCPINIRELIDKREFDVPI